MMRIVKCFSAPILVAVFLVSSFANAALIERLSGLAYYDDVADLTWLADAHYAATQYVNSGGSEGDADGRMTWDVANTWVAGLNIAGVTGWRLPATFDIGNDGCNLSYTGTDCGYNMDPSTGELTNLFNNVLGNVPFYDINGVRYQPGWGISNTGPFINVQAGYYWSSAEYAPDSNQAWTYSTFYSNQAYGIKESYLRGWAVQTGDVGAVPVPAAAWLFGSGLIGLIGIAKCKKA